MRIATLILLASAAAYSASAQAENFGSWFTGKTNDGNFVFAATVNDSGHLLGQYCSPETGNCLWMLGIGTTCKLGDKYPILANSDTGANHLSVHCDEQLDDGKFRYVFSKFDEIDGIIKGGLRVGFALPLQSDNFRVIRFDLSGANRAIKFMHSNGTKTTPKTKGTKDQYL